ncbi:MAG: hypothetical protein A2350_08435 [Candidatus Raymondbacteria bacterium RifOxyB12_full_50_8]|nr:MAG: hypothetical protein A2350_08435 [Candidatus Raymondbacteria bacterium RifOxyB12_full_50_8]
MYQTFFKISRYAKFVFELLPGNMPSPFIEVNKAACDLVGYSREELCQRSFSDITFEHEPGVFAMQTADLVKNGDGIFERILIKKNNEKTPVEAHCHLFTEQGKRMVYSIVNDISVRKRYEKNLIDLNNAFVSMGHDYHDNLAILIEMCARVLRASYALYNKLQGENMVTEAQWNAPVAQLVNKIPCGHVCVDIIMKATMDTTYVFDNLEELCPLMERKSSADKPTAVSIGYPVFSFDRPTGIICMVFNNCAALTEDQKQVLSIISRAIGVEEECHQFEEIARERETIYRMLFEAAPDAIEIIDAEDRVIDVNSMHEDLTGYSWKDVVGKGLRELIPVQFHDRLYQIMDTIRRNGFYEFETIMVRKDGVRITVWRKVKALFTPEGQYRGCVIFNRDLTQRKLAEAQELHAERMAGVLEMAGAACHELNQPLQAILGYTDLLLKNVKADLKSVKWAQRIQEQVMRFAEITTKLNHVTKYEVKEYLEGTKIINLEKAAQQQE